MSDTLLDELAEVKLGPLSKRWWISTGARLEGPKLETGSRPPTRGSRAFIALCLAFVAFK